MTHTVQPEQFPCDVSGRELCRMGTQTAVHPAHTRHVMLCSIHPLPQPHGMLASMSHCFKPHPPGWFVTVHSGSVVVDTVTGLLPAVSVTVYSKDLVETSEHTVVSVGGVMITMDFGVAVMEMVASLELLQLPEGPVLAEPVTLKLPVVHAVIPQPASWQLSVTELVETACSNITAGQQQWTVSLGFESSRVLSSLLFPKHTVTVSLSLKSSGCLSRRPFIGTPKHTDVMLHQTDGGGCATNAAHNMQAQLQYVALILVVAAFRSPAWQLGKAPRLT